MLMIFFGGVISGAGLRSVGDQYKVFDGRRMGGTSFWRCGAICYAGGRLPPRMDTLIERVRACPKAEVE